MRDALEREQAEVIAKKDAALAASAVKAAQYVDEIRQNHAELAVLQDAEPVQPELEREPLVINLRAQIASLTLAFDLSQKVVAEKDVQLQAWPEKFNALQAIADARLTTIGIKDNRIAALENVVSKYDKKHRLTIRLFGLKIDLLNDVIKPGGAVVVYSLLKK